MGIPRRIGAFVPFAEIAQGPATSVYKAHDPEHDRIVVVKLLQRQAAGDDDLTRRFRIEAAALRAVRSPYVVDIVAFGECDGGLYIATQFVEGESLRSLLAARSVPAVIGAYIVRQAVAGLAAVHEAGLLHRDFKPSNIVVGENGEVRLLDFGFARSPSDGDALVAGTVGYLAPELLAGDDPDRRSDLYSAGVTLAEVLTGRSAERLAPARADGRTSIARGSAYEDIREILSAQGIDQRLAACAGAMASSDPSERPGDAVAALARLDAALDSYRPTISPGTLTTWLAGERITLPRQVPGVTADSERHRSHSDVDPAGRDGDTIRAPTTTRWRAGMFAAAAIVTLAILADSSLRSDDPVAPTGTETPALTPALSESRTTADEEPEHPGEYGELENPETTNDEPAPPSDDPERQPEAGAIDANLASAAGIAQEPDVAGETDPGATDPDRESETDESPNDIVPSVDPNAPATVTIVALPWAHVTVDGESVGVTPLATPIVLDPGMYTIRFENPDFPTYVVPFEAAPGDTADVRVSLWSTVARVMLSVTPWAEVLVDGSVRDTIPPMDQPLILRPGEATMTLRHPDLGIYETTLHVQADSTYRYSFNLFDLARD